MSSTVAGPAAKSNKIRELARSLLLAISCSLQRGKYSVLPASALALSTALLTAKRTEELRAIGGSPTAIAKNE
jgi:hypothetical protein